MSYEQEFLQEFEKWVDTQIMVNELAMKESEKIWQDDKDERAKEAFIRYESKLDAYRYLQGKFVNYHDQKGFHDLPDSLFGKRKY